MSRFKTMIKALSTYAYELIVESRLLYYFLSFLLPYIPSRLLSYGPRQFSHVEEIVDASGKVLTVSRWNNRTYFVGCQSLLPFVKAMRIRQTDILLCSYPKAGAHWVHEILHSLVNKQPQLTRYGKELDGMIEGLPHVLFDSLPSPRVLNSHLLYDQLPREVQQKKIKIVLMLRNPKDTVVSYYNHHKSMAELYGYTGSFSDYFRLFMDGRLEYGDYFNYILEWDSVMKTMTNNPIFPLTYEDLREKPKECIINLAHFLQIPVTDAFAEEVIKACDFENLQTVRKTQNKTLGKIYRKGKIERIFICFCLGFFFFPLFIFLRKKKMF